MTTLTTQTAKSLESRVTAFRCMELPGQPMSMHMGTSYLVNDLWSKVKEQAAEIERLKTELKDAERRVINRTAAMNYIQNASDAWCEAERKL